MEEKITSFQEVQLLLAFIKSSDGDGNIDFEKTNISHDLAKIVTNGNWLDSLLYKFDEAGVLKYEEIGEDGFKPIIIAGITSNTYIYLDGLISKLKDEYEDLENRIAEIFTFNPNVLSKSISATKLKLDSVSDLVKNNELLKPIEQPLKEIRRHFESVYTVSSNYEDIYKNIIRPVQEEGRSGVKATVKWAVISIIISTILSLIISNWHDLSLLMSNA